MIRKTLISLLLIGILFVFLKPINSTMISVFNIANAPVVVTKGHYGTSLVVEVSFSDESLMDWLKTVKEPYPLLLLDTDWIKRSPDHIKIIQERKLPTGLLGPEDSIEEPINIKLVQKDIDIYEQYLKEKPLWFATRNHQYSQDLQKSLFQQQMNLLSPSLIWQGEKTPKLQKGDFVFVPLHQDSSITFKELNTFIQQHKFMSIEENIFGYKVQTKKSP
ncbi:hypothetical protein D0439_01060 [Lysinibacillus fusiformis]|jgi:hypothetical protein|uniref:hypothetical protein n=1 Tax=Lysinibacillus TaxID=400634 RepID=UPI0004D3C7DF|nr:MULTISPECIES: hypothetical protein [Lysinibacillus]MDC6269864.1 hypothetical protein [Lysinibacillus sphaericus]AJK85927.1 hypothetical protein HR49_01165 [Lysinibacillus fusiformis]KAB0447506.1 hypothetical protein CH314_01025 [Lysinibacillus fusiformis]KGA82226.1 hypothetical protein KQ41_13615 [Lysinibacillus fusiformis]KHK50485.1 hypothetical protein PI85_17590 [Lysinibacillus sp. A1]